MYLGQPLLIPVNLRLWKILQVLIQLCQRLGVIPTEVNLLPQVFRRVGPFDCFNVQMHPAVFFTDCCVFGVGEGTGGAIAEAGGGVGVFAELFFVLVGSFGFCDGGFVGAELMVDYLPDHFVVLHDGKLVCWGGQ